jgi:hypothetical protein
MTAAVPGNALPSQSPIVHSQRTHTTDLKFRIAAVHQPIRHGNTAGCTQLRSCSALTEPARAHGDGDIVRAAGAHRARTGAHAQARTGARTGAHRRTRGAQAHMRSVGGAPARSRAVFEDQLYARRPAAAAPPTARPTEPSLPSGRASPRLRTLKRRSAVVQCTLQCSAAKPPVAVSAPLEPQR